MIKMRAFGIAIPKRQLPREQGLYGNLTIAETKGNDLNRIVRLAKFICKIESSAREQALYDPFILWMHDDRFVLTGFERIGSHRGDIDYAQSWLCKVEPDETLE